KLTDDPNHRIVYGSEGLAHPRKVLGRVKRRMTDPAVAGEFLERFGPFYVPGQERQGKPLGAGYFTVVKSQPHERDYSMEARGWRSKIAGTRCDTMILDDIQSLISLGLTEKILGVLRQDWFTRPGQDGVTVIIGTRVGVGDVYQRLIEEEVIDEL